MEGKGASIAEIYAFCENLGIKDYPIDDGCLVIELAKFTNPDDEDMVVYVDAKVNCANLNASTICIWGSWPLESNVYFSLTKSNVESIEQIIDLLSQKGEKDAGSIKESKLEKHLETSWECERPARSGVY